VIAVVVPEDLPVAAQLPPGQQVRFAVVDPHTLAPVNQDTSQEFAVSTASEGNQP
jgi:allophanate hydrolase subunit 2